MIVYTRLFLASLISLPLITQANVQLPSNQMNTISDAQAEINFRHDYLRYTNQCKPIKNKDAHWLCISRIFLGRPYQFDAMGDTHKGDFDPRPLWQTQTMDCMTLADVILALLASHDYESFKHHLVKIRYQNSHIAYLSRHHFMSSEWNPSNQAHGYIQDITESIKINKRPLTKTIENVIHYPNWLKFQKSHHRPHTLKQRLIWIKHQALAKPKKASLPHIPLADFFSETGKVKHSLLKQIPSGSIIEFTCPNWQIQSIIGTSINIAHFGFVFRQGQTLMLLHASPDTKKVSLLPLADYLIRAREKIKFIEGINLQAILIQPPE